MPKISGLPNDTNPTTDDYAVSLDSGSTTTKKSTWANLITLFFGNIPAGSVTAPALSTDSSWTWQSWTPTWTAAGAAPAIGNGTLVARYAQIGKTVVYSVSIVFGTTSTFSTGDWAFTVPVAPKTTLRAFIGSAYGLDAGINYYAGSARLSSSSGTVTCHNSAGTGGAWGVSIPFAWGNLDEFAFTIIYEAL